MGGAVKAARPYRTALRSEQAQLTRERILEAARRLLVERGYGRVTMQDVAREAGVAYQTVFSRFRSKEQLALELCAAHLGHVGGVVAGLAAARDAGDLEACLGTLGGFARELYEPCAEVLRFMRESGEPELLARYREIGARRFELLAGLAPQLERSGRLLPGLPAGRALDLLWTLAGPETYEQFVLDRGWSPGQFQDWLNAAAASLVLAPRADSPRRRGAQPA